MFGIDGDLHVVADEVLAVGAFHLPAVGVGEGHFVLAAGLQLAQQLVVMAVMFLELSDLFLQPLSAGRGGHPFGLGVLPIQFAQILFDAGFDLLEQFAQLFLGVVAAGIVHCLELAAVDGHQFGAEEFQAAAEQVEMFEQGFKGGAVVAAEVGDGFEVRSHAAQQPDQFQIAGGFGFQAAAGADAVQVAVEVKLEQVCRMIGWPAGDRRLGVGEAQGLKVQALDVGVDEAGGGIGGDVIVQAGREQLDFGSVGAAQVAHGFGRSERRRRPRVQKNRRKVFTQSVTVAATPHVDVTRLQFPRPPAARIA